MSHNDNNETSTDSDYRAIDDAVDDEDDLNSNGQGTNMILGANGFIVESAESNVAVMYNPRKRRVDIRNIPSMNRPIEHNVGSAADGNLENRASLWVQGAIVSENTNILSFIRGLQKRIEILQDENVEMKKMLEELYYAPGMPGFVKVQEEFYAIASQENDQENKVNNIHVTTYTTILE